MIWALSIIVVFLVLIVALLVWYIKTFFVRLRLLVRDFAVLKSKIKEYAEHLQHVHSLEMFYGEPTLMELIKHSKKILIYLKQTDKLFSSIIEDEDEKETVKIDGEETEDEENE